jgi:hypothetical protein
MMLTALARVVQALNGAQIEPVLLKGCARLVENTYPDPALRILGDLDVLVPQERCGSAFAALQDAGFAAKAASLTAAHHHLDVLHDPETEAGVEIHHNLVPAWLAEFPIGWFLDGCQVAPFRSLRVRLPDATRSAAHNILHDQLNNRNFRLARFELRQLLDLAMIRARHESSIDWQQLDAILSAVGLGKSMATYLEFAHVFFGQPPPGLTHAPRRHAVDRLRDRMMSQGKWRLRSGANVVRDYVEAVRSSPLGVLKIVHPLKLGRAARTFAKAFLAPHGPRW